MLANGGSCPLYVRLSPRIDWPTVVVVRSMYVFLPKSPVDFWGDDEDLRHATICNLYIRTRLSSVPDELLPSHANFKLTAVALQKCAVLHGLHNIVGEDVIPRHEIPMTKRVWSHVHLPFRTRLRWTDLRLGCSRPQKASWRTIWRLMFSVSLRFHELSPIPYSSSLTDDCNYDQDETYASKKKTGWRW